MCYTAKYLTQKKLKYAKRRGDTEAEIKKIETELEILTKDYEAQYCVSAYVHPRILIFTNQEPAKPQMFSWGLIPGWVKDEKQALQMQNKTINARLETIFEKPSYRMPANKQRCVIMLDGFYEYFHFNNKYYPIHITSKDSEPMVVGGLWDVWKLKNEPPFYSVSLVTTKAKGIMGVIHNNPKLPEPRMPLFLSPENERSWLDIYCNKDQILAGLREGLPLALNAFPVSPIQGNKAKGNVIGATQAHDYPEISCQTFTDIIHANN